MDYKNEMRKLIDIVKQQGLDAPLEDTLDDLKVLSNAQKELTDRIEMRVRKSLQPTDKDKGKVSKSSERSKKPRARQSSQKFPTSKPQQPSQSNTALPTTNSPTTSAISQADYNNAADNFKAQQRSLSPISPQPPI